VTLRNVAVTAAFLLAATACGGGDSDGGTATVTTTPPAATTPVTSGPPTVLAIVAPAAGTVIGGNVVRLDVTSSGISIVGADGDTSGRTGHYHVYIDREPVEPGEVIRVEEGIIHTTDDPIVIPGLSVGPHRLTVVYGDGTHRRIGFTEAGTSFTVSGPSIDASAPPVVLNGQPVTITVKVEGLAFPEDGFLYVLVDRDPPPAGEPIPDDVLQTSETTIAIPDLAPGHTVWVVAGSADRIPLDPPVMDKVTVTVA
jgi:hypothetical protein